MAIQRKYERDIDLLLAEEFEVNANFAQWFKAKTRFADVDAAVVEVQVSAADNLGESDLIVFFKENDGGTFALMIEDKIDAPLQPEQASRYKLRGARSVEAGQYEDFEVVLCAPRCYLERPDIEGFPVHLAYEDIGAYFLNNDQSPRAKYRGEFISTAAVRRANVWKSDPDEQTTAFWDAAYDLATRQFPILEMKRLTPTKDQMWISFRPRDMPSLPKRTHVIVKGDRGMVDLTFANTVAYKFEEQVRPILESDMTIHQTNKSAAIRLRTPNFTMSDGVEAGIPKIRQCFEAAQRLIRFYRLNQANLVAAARDASAG